MRELYLKRFALLFSVLILFQEGGALLQENFLVNHRLRRNVYSEEKITAVDLPQSREKRFVGTALIVISALSSGLDIYKQVRGCKDITPDLNNKISEGKELQKTLLNLKDQVNLAWVPAESREQYTKRLASNMIIIREQVSTFDSLQADLVKLLDQKLLDKLNNVSKQLENEVDRNNETQIGSFEDLEVKYMDTTTFALTITSKLLPLGFLLGTKYLLPKITARFTKDFAKTWASSNPGRVQKMLNGFAEKKGKFLNWKADKINQFKLSLSTKWNSFKAKFPRVQSAMSKITNSKFGKALGSAMSKVKKVAVSVGKGAVVAFFIAFEVWNFIQFKGQCEEKYSKALSGISTMTENKKNMTKLLDEIHGMKGKADEYYNLLKSNLTDSDFLNFLDNIANLSANAKEQTKAIVDATKQIRQYKVEIVNADDEKTNVLNTMLVNAFANINFKLDCLRSKLSIIKGVIDDCSIGLGVFDDIYAKALAKQKKITETCIAGHYMDKNEIKGLLDSAMELDKKQIMCVRNNPTKKQLICEKWYDDVSDADILKTNPDLTQADITYFITSCPPASVNDQTKNAICVKKNSDLVTLQSIQQTYHKYDQAQIKSAYQECQLSSSSVTVICTDKKEGQTVEYVQQKFPVFPASMVSTAFNSCKKETNITPADKMMICLLKKNGFALDSPVMANYVKNYDYDTLKAFYDSC